MSKYFTNKGTKLEIGSGSGNDITVVKVPRLRTVPGLAMEDEKIEVTHHESVNREFIPSGLPDPGDYGFEMETDRTSTVHQQIFELKKTGDVVPWRLTYPDGLAYQFSASVLSIVRADADPQSPDVIIDTVNLSISGDIEDVSDQLLS